MGVGGAFRPPPPCHSCVYLPSVYAAIARCVLQYCRLRYYSFVFTKPCAATGTDDQPTIIIHPRLARFALFKTRWFLDRMTRPGTAHRSCSGPISTAADLVRATVLDDENPGSSTGLVGPFFFFAAAAKEKNTCNNQVKRGKTLFLLMRIQTLHQRPPQQMCRAALRRWLLLAAAALRDRLGFDIIIASLAAHLSVSLSVSVSASAAPQPTRQISTGGRESSIYA